MKSFVIKLLLFLALLPAAVCAEENGTSPKAGGNKARSVEDKGIREAFEQFRKKLNQLRHESSVPSKLDELATMSLHQLVQCLKRSKAPSDRFYLINYIGGRLSAGTPRERVREYLGAPNVTSAERDHYTFGGTNAIVPVTPGGTDSVDFEFKDGALVGCYVSIRAGCIF